LSKHNFAGKSVFVTGAGSGIGYAIALAFAGAGTDIIATDVSQEGLDRLRPEVENHGVKCRLEILNVADDQAFQALADQLASDNSLPDIVVNNAGIAYVDSFVNTTQEQWRRTLDVNVLGVVSGSRIFSQLWLQAGKPGHLVNIASAASITPVPNMAAYAASKYAVEGLCEVMAMELEDSNIHVSCVHPGIIKTTILQHNDRLAIPAEQLQRLQRYYVDNGVDPSVVAQDILNGVNKKTNTIFTGPGTTLAPFLKRIMSRPLFRSLLRREARKVGYL
jgi:short-subunit dehydrogenase